MKIIADNKKAFFNYEILETFEAGISLSGPEVKSIRAGHISLKESFATVRGQEIMLTNAHIPPYKPAGNQNNEPTRPRKLLLRKEEISKLIGKVQQDKLTLIPLKVYTKHNLIKIELGLARGRKKFDKREVIKKRDQQRDIERAMKDKVND